MSLSRIDTLRMVDPVLTTIAQGYSNASLVADLLMPVVQVSKLKGKIPLFGREAFLTRDSNRALRAQSNRIPPSELTLAEFETIERDIECAIDYLEEEESPDYSRIEQRITKQLVDSLLLSREKDVADYVQNPANFDSGLKLVIDSNNAFDDYSNNTDPIKVIRDAMIAVRNRIARYPNTMIIGDSSYQTLISHPTIIERIKYSGITAINTQYLSEVLGIPNIYVGLSVYSTDGSSFTDVWSDNIILAFVDANDKSSRSEYNPSYGYILQREGKPEIDTYTENGGKIKVIRNTDNYCFKVTAPDAAYLISNTNHSS